MNDLIFDTTKLRAGARMVGKTAIVSQFLYDTFIGMYQETVDDMYHGEFDVGGCDLALKIQV